MANNIKHNSLNPAAVPDAGPSDGWLAQQAAAGCAASFEQLVARYTPRLLRFLQRHTFMPFVIYRVVLAALVIGLVVWQHFLLTG